MISFFVGLLSIHIAYMFTPSPSVWERKVLIGVGDEQYFNYTFQRNYTGTYYHYVDSVFFDIVSIQNGQLNERKLLRAIDHNDTTTHNDWMHEELVTPTINVSQFLIEKSISPVFPSHTSFKEEFDFNNSGLIIRNGSKSQSIIPLYVVRKHVPWIDQTLKLAILEGNVDAKDNHTQVVSCYFENQYIFLIVQTGGSTIDTDLKQAILPVPLSQYKEGRRSLNRQ
ncbi:MAG: hypothetical protein AAFX87_07975 [Bacteroidota bacterium]